MIVDGDFVDDFEEEHELLAAPPKKQEVVEESKPVFEMTNRKVFIKDETPPAPVTKPKPQQKMIRDPEETQVPTKPTARGPANVIFIIPFATPGSGKSFCWAAI